MEDLTDPKQLLHRYLRVAREALLWKLEGLTEYDVRRPLTPTGTNLLGLVKHLAVVELGYFGDTFGRRHGETFPWDDDSDRDPGPNQDMYAAAHETRADILALYARAATHSDATIEALALDDEGHVPWWPDDVNPVTLHWILVHMTSETNRHLGHADILREELDGAIGHRDGVSNLPDEDAAWWASYRATVEAAARAGADRAAEA